MVGIARDRNKRAVDLEGRHPRRRPDRLRLGVEPGLVEAEGHDKAQGARLGRFRSPELSCPPLDGISGIRSK